MPLSFGDYVTIVASAATSDLGLQGKSGQVVGFSVPSSSGVKVVGTLSKDFAVAVFLDGSNEDVWLPEELLEFQRSGEGTIVQMGNFRAVLQADGSWKETIVNDKSS